MPGNCIGIIDGKVIDPEPRHIARLTGRVVLVARDRVLECMLTAVPALVSVLIIALEIVNLSLEVSRLLATVLYVISKL